MQDVIWQSPQHDAVRERTSERANRRIDRQTLGAIEQVLDSPDDIRARLAELDREWNVDRALMLNFAILGTATATLAMRNLRTTGRLGGWGALFFTQMGFLAYHAVRRWCPPMPVFRRFGVRSEHEIAAERVALEKRLAELEELTSPA
jgi:hypothetical protein